MDQNTVAAGEAEFDPARERTVLVNALAEAARAALEFDPLAAAVLGAIPSTEPQQYVMAGMPAGISKMLPAISGELPAVITNKTITLGELVAYTHGLRDARHAAAELANAAPSPVSEAQAERVPDVTGGIWYEGEPPHPYGQEWFIAETIYDDRVVLKALPEEFTYDYKTADETYMLAKNVKRWMQFPDSEYIAPTATAKEAAQASAQAAPTDLSKRLRRAAEEGLLPLLRRPDILAAADEIERYYGGMLNWKRTAEEKDASAQAAAAEVRDAARYRFLREKMCFSGGATEPTMMSMSARIPAPDHDFHTDWIGDRFDSSVDATVDGAIRSAVGTGEQA